jgi:hypothetical protein
MKNGNMIDFDRISDPSKTASRTDSPPPAKSTALSPTTGTSPLQSTVPVSAPSSLGLTPEANGGSQTKSSSTPVPAKIKAPFASSSSFSMARTEKGEMQKRSIVPASSAARDGKGDKETNKNKKIKNAEKGKEKLVDRHEKENSQKRASTAHKGMKETNTPSTIASVRNLLLCRHLPQAVRASSLGMRVCGAVPTKVAP